MAQPMLGEIGTFCEDTLQNFVYIVSLKAELGEVALAWDLTYTSIK